MKSPENSLRAMVHRWFGAEPARVTRFGRVPSNGQRYAHVEVVGRPDAPGLYFFRHVSDGHQPVPGDGGSFWAVYMAPPSNPTRLDSE